MPTFSIIIVNYNGKDFLRKTLEKINAGSLKSDRVIVVDDCSTDGSFEIV